MSRKEYKINHTKAWCYFIALGLLPYNAKKNEWVLHHKDPELRDKDPVRYNEWRIEDLVPMLKSEHTSMHQKGRHLSEETKAKISAKLKGHTVSKDTRAKISKSCKGHTSWLKGTHGVITAWNKGKGKIKPLPKTKDEKGLYWITDGINNTRIVKDASIPDGWHKGRAHMIYKTKPGPKTT